MSIESMAIALHHSQAKGAARLVLVGIANHDGDGGAWPSVATLAKYAGITARNVQKHIDALQELGEIERMVQQGGTRQTPDWGRPNLYRFLLRCPAGCDRTKNHRVVDKSPDPLSVATPGVGSDTPPVSVATPAPLSVATPEPPIEPSMNTASVWSSTSPANQPICWACGQPKCAPGAKYCTDCSSRGFAQPWIECNGCGAVKRRDTPGMNAYTCRDCQPRMETTE